MTITKKKNMLIILLFVIINGVGILSLPNSSDASESYYVSQTARGGNSGADCADAYAVSWFNTSGNWANPKVSGKIGPGDTVHLCGTFTGTAATTILTVQNSGSAGSPITIKWETGATLTSPVCSSSGCINANNRSYIIFDGNGTNPSITNTANGKGLTYQQSTGGIVANPCNNCEFKNLSITNMYVQTAPADTTGTGVGISVNGSNWSVHDNSISDAFVCLDSAYQNGDSNIQIYKNTFNNMNWGLHIGNNAPTSLSNVYIHDNHLMNMDNWDSATDQYHHDGLFVVQNNTSAQITNVHFYNNLADGRMSTWCPANIGTTCATAWIFYNTGMNGIYVYNNVLIGDGSSYLIEAGYNGDKNYYIMNNVFDCNNASAIAVGPINGLTIKNNVANNCYTYWTTHDLSGTISVDYNAFDSAHDGSGHAFKWNGNNSGATLAQYQSATGLDSHSLSLASWGWNTSYQLLSGSSLSGNGTNLTSLGITTLDTDMAGAPRPSSGAWDIGAYNYGSSISIVRPNPPVLILVN